MLVGFFSGLHCSANGLDCFSEDPAFRVQSGDRKKLHIFKQIFFLRERAYTHESGVGRSRGRECQADSILSLEPNTGLKLDPEIMT